MKWFRMYDSMVDSVKVGCLNDADFRTYVELQCLASQVRDGGRTGVTAESIAWRLRRDGCDASHLVTVTLLKIGDDGEYIVTDWEERQPNSDTSAERTRAWREKKAKALIPKSGDGGDSHGDGGDGHGDAIEESRGEENTPSASNKILFDADKGVFVGINVEHRAVWSKAFPAVDVPTEISKAAAWLVANPRNRKSNNNRFISNWCLRAQERAARVPGSPIAEPKRRFD